MAVQNKVVSFEKYADRKKKINGERNMKFEWKHIILSVIGVALAICVSCMTVYIVFNSMYVFGKWLWKTLL